MFTSKQAENAITADRAKPGSFGLLGMQQRVRALGGTLRLKRARGGGVTVEVVLPAGAAAGA